MGVDFKRLGYGHRMLGDGCPSFLGFGVGGRSYGNFPASTVVLNNPHTLRTNLSYKSAYMLRTT